MRPNLACVALTGLAAVAEPRNRIGSAPQEAVATGQRPAAPGRRCSVTVAGPQCPHHCRLHPDVGRSVPGTVPRSADAVTECRSPPWPSPLVSPTPMSASRRYSTHSRRPTHSRRTILSRRSSLTLVPFHFRSPSERSPRSSRASRSLRRPSVRRQESSGQKRGRRTGECSSPTSARPTRSARWCACLRRRRRHPRGGPGRPERRHRGRNELMLADLQTIEKAIPHREGSQRQEDRARRARRGARRAEAGGCTTLFLVPRRWHDVAPPRRSP